MDVRIKLMLLCCLWIVGSREYVTAQALIDGYDPVYNPDSRPPGGSTKDFLPVSPTAGSLGIYGKIPVGNYTGTAVVNVPLYEIKYRKLALPIGINYNGSGNKPDLFPGPVGLGWSITAGGSISRIIRGNPDYEELPDDGHSEQILTITGSRKGDDWYNHKKLENYVRDKVYERDNLNDPDEFVFNINGQTGKFYLDHQDTFRIKSAQGEMFFVELMHEENVKLDFLPLSQTRKLQGIYIDFLYNNSIVKEKLLYLFKMTDTKGVIYYFGGSDSAVEFSRPGWTDSTPGRETKDIVPMTWHLVSIQSPEGDMITFEYGQQTIVTKIRFTDLVTYQINNGDIRAEGDDDSWKSTLINGCYLKKIYFSGGSVSFSNSMATEQLDYPQLSAYGPFIEDRISFKAYQDVLLANTEKIVGADTRNDAEMVRNNFFPQKIDEMTVLDNMGNVIRKVKFVYTQDRNTRLKLLGLTISGNTKVHQRYSFEYNPLSLPPYLSGQEDYYGFYNGKPRYEGIPAGTIRSYLLGNPNYLDSIKSSDPDYVQAEMLQKVTYPTGGYTQFEYEPHQYASVYETWPFHVVSTAANEITSGVRIKSVKNYNADGTPLSTMNYYYVKDYLNGGSVSSGVLAYKPVHLESLQNKYAPKGKIRINNYKRWSTNPVYPVDERGSHIAYSEVTVGMPGNGYTVYKYKNYDNGYVDKELLDYAADNVYENIDGTGGKIEFYKQEEGISMDLERGQLLSECYYDDGKNLKKEIQYIYNDNPERFEENVRFLRFIPTVLNNFGGYKFYQVTAGLIYTYYPYVKEKKEIFYENAKSQQITKYTYYEKYRLPEKIIYENSASQSFATQYFYPFNEQSNEAVYKEMLRYYMINYPVKEVQFLDNVICDVIKRKYSGGLALGMPWLILPAEESHGRDEQHIRKEKVITDYDSYGNPMGMEVFPYKNFCILWSYNGLYPVVKIEGLSFEQVVAELGNEFVDRLSSSSNPSDTDIESVRNKLAKYGNEIMITTYTHRPLIGVSSITNPNLIRVTYHYDDFGRLEYIQDNFGKKINSYHYHYKK